MNSTNDQVLCREPGPSTVWNLGARRGACSPGSSERSGRHLPCRISSPRCCARTAEAARDQRFTCASSNKVRVGASADRPFRRGRRGPTARLTLSVSRPKLLTCPARRAAACDELLAWFDLTQAAHKGRQKLLGGMRRRAHKCGGRHSPLDRAPGDLPLTSHQTGLDPAPRETLWDVVRREPGPATGYGAAHHPFTLSRPDVAQPYDDHR